MSKSPLFLEGSPPENEPVEALVAALSLLLKRKDWVGCTQVCLSILKFRPDDYFSLETLTTAYLQTGNVEMATETSWQLLAACPRDPYNRLRLAALLQSSGRTNEAVVELEQVLAMYPNDSFSEEARETMDQLDREQTQEILMRATHSTEFRWQLEHDLPATLENSHYYLSETGLDALRQMLPDPDEEEDNGEATVRWH